MTRRLFIFPFLLIAAAVSAMAYDSSKGTDYHFGGSYVGAGAGTFVGVIIGAPIGVIFLGECGAATGSAVGGGIGSTIGTIIGYYTGKNIGTAIYDLFQEYLDIITH